MIKEERTYTLDELCSLVDLSRRTVRYYIQIGLLAAPVGAGRGAHYEQRHLEQLLEIRKWQQAGLSLDRIRDLLGPDPETSPTPPPKPRQKGTIEVWSHIVIDNGIELTIDPERANLKPEEVRALINGVNELYESIRFDKENKK